MKQSDLDKQLQQLYLEDIDDAFVEWCNDVIPQFPIVHILKLLTPIPRVFS